MKYQNINIQNVTCKGFVKTLSTMLLKIEGVDSVEIEQHDSSVAFKIESAIPRQKLMEHLIAAGLDSQGKVKSCKKCIVEKLEAIK